MDARPRFIVRELALGALAIAEFALVTLIAILGVGFSPVLSRSMGDALPVGSVAISVRAPTSSLAKGDVVQLALPDEQSVEYVHRIDEIHPTPQGISVRTKGDANPMRDPWVPVIVSPDTPKVIGYIPALGYVHNWTNQYWMRYLILALVISLLLLVAYRLVMNALKK
jgi:signal peptidase